jgi:uncharacterized BrkB/YihY/UPF0761 family membrane protein
VLGFRLPQDVLREWNGPPNQEQPQITAAHTSAVRIAGRLLGAALLAAFFSIVAMMLVFALDDPCGGPNPSDDCGWGYLIGAVVILPPGFVIFFAAWAVSLNARLALGWRIACGLVVTALVLGATAAYAIYYKEHDEPGPLGAALITPPWSYW